jgi:predicted signal transduction protein with EAL and GGDEF domain
VVEITETAAMDDLEQSRHFVNALKKAVAASPWTILARALPHCANCNICQSIFLEIDRDFVKLLPDDAASIRMVQTPGGLGQRPFPGHGG